MCLCCRVQVRCVPLLCQSPDEAARVCVLPNGPIDAEAVLRYLRPVARGAQPEDVRPDQEAADRQRDVPLPLVSGDGL